MRFLEGQRGLLRSGLSRPAAVGPGPAVRRMTVNEQTGAVVIRAPLHKYVNGMGMRAAAKPHRGRLLVFDLLAAEERNPPGAAPHRQKTRLLRQWPSRVRGKTRANGSKGNHLDETCRSCRHHPRRRRTNLRRQRSVPRSSRARPARRIADTPRDRRARRCGERLQMRRNPHNRDRRQA